MDSQLLQAHFNKIGASLKIELTNGRTDYSLDVREHQRTEKFVLRVNPDIAPTIEFVPMNVEPKLRHLLLMAVPEAGDKTKFLCGHDERHWFVASVGPVSSVRAALESLKPDLAKVSQLRSGVRRTKWNSRHNAGFMRQGEWFFIRMPDFVPDPTRLLHHNEPIARSGGKAHRVEWLYRSAGESVYVSRQHPNGLSREAYESLIRRKPETKTWRWRVMQRNMIVYAQGKITHPDHATLVLPFWHRVMMNRQVFSNNVVFLD